MLLKHLLIGFILATFGLTAAQAQTTWSVDDDCTPPGTGTAEDPFCTIQAGIDAANPGDEIVISPGIYRGEGNRDLDFGGTDLTVRSTDPQDPAVVAVTIIDCEGTGGDPHRGFIFQSGETADSVISGLTITNGHAGDGADGTVPATDGDEGGHGGGVYCSGASPMITNCVLIANSAGDGGDGLWHHDYPVGDGGHGGHGGAVYCDNASPSITGCVLVANSAGTGGEVTSEGIGGPGGSGGAIYCGGGSPDVSGTTFAGNSAGDGGRGAMLAGSGGSGGAVYASATIPMMADCVITNNSAGNGGITTDYDLEGGAGGSGGGICSAVDLTLLGCTIVGNTAGSGSLSYYGEGGNGGSGGGVSCGANATITQCFITGNSAGDGATGFFDYSGGDGGTGGGVSCGDNAAISVSVIAGNAAGDGGSGDFPPALGGDGGDGGGVFCGGNAAISNCVIERNTAGRGGNGGENYDGGDGGSGGGICCAQSASVGNCTIHQNISGDGGDGGLGGSYGTAGTGGGAYLGNASTLTNGIAWDNMAAGAPQVDGPVGVTYSCIEAGIGGTGNISDEPLFVGGPDDDTWTIDGEYELDTYQTTFTDGTQDWTVDELLGKLVNPDNAQLLEFVIVGNTANTITVWGDASAIAQANDTYEIHDYHLQQISPCINAGDPGFDPDPGETDIDGDDRVQHCRVDMGADETPYIGPDCNQNDTADACDIEAGISSDLDGSNIPDECEPCPCGDIDRSGGPVDLGDFATFAVCYGVSSPWGSCPVADFQCSDMDGDQTVDLGDFASFAAFYGLEVTYTVPDCILP